MSKPIDKASRQVNWTLAIALIALTGKCDSPATMDTAPNEAFFDTLPVFEEFEGVADAGNYRPLPDSWVLASADIVGSTKAIATAATRRSTWRAPA